MQKSARPDAKALPILLRPARCPRFFPSAFACASPCVFRQARRLQFSPSGTPGHAFPAPAGRRFRHGRPVPAKRGLCPAQRYRTGSMFFPEHGFYALSPPCSGATPCPGRRTLCPPVGFAGRDAESPCPFPRLCSLLPHSFPVLMFSRPSLAEQATEKPFFGLTVVFNFTIA